MAIRSPRTWRLGGGFILTAAGPHQADIVIDGDRIVAVEPPASDPDVDATGRWVLPGAVDAHTHFGMPLAGGLTSLGWRDSSAAALLGGTTTVVDFANPDRGEPLPAVVGRWQARADGETLCDYGLHVTVTDTAPERLGEIPEVVRLGVPTIKGFLAYKGRLMLNPDEMGGLMLAVSAAGGLLLVHAEDGEMNAEAERILVDTGRTAPVWHPAAHPAESEVQAVAQAIAMARRTGCPLLVVHMSTAGALEHLRRARTDTDASPVLGEVCVHHLFAEATLYEGGHEAALAAICSPPLRSAADGAALLAGLGAGDIDLLSTDHCEFALRDKLQAAAGGFPRVPNGCGGVGERMVFSYSRAVATGELHPFRWQEVACRLPAETMGLAGRKGRLAPGHDADVVLFDPRPSYRWVPLGASDRAGSIWAGAPVTGRVTDVWLRGRRVVTDGRLCDDQPGGRFLPRRLTNDQAHEGS